MLALTLHLFVTVDRVAQTLIKFECQLKLI